MPLNHQLCFVLPADFDDDDEPQNRIQTQTPTKQGIPNSPRRHRAAQILEYLHKSFYNFIESKWLTFRNRKVPKRLSSGLFHDTEGVQIMQKIGATSNPRTFSYAELYIGSKGFSKDEILGSGGFGRVYRAVLPSDGTVVAVKCLAEKGERFEKTFAAELVAMTHLRHRNLVSLRGWCVYDDQLLLVYDYMPNTSLDRILFRRSEKVGGPFVLDWERRVKIVNGLAAALNYLHEKLETQIIHRDVKASNVMLDSDYNAKLGDFGLARWLEHELDNQMQSPSIKYYNHQFRLVETTKIGGTIGYLPPENFNRRGVATAKSDVFSFGIVVLEIVTGRRAVDLSYQDDQIVLLDWIRRLSDEGMVLQAGDSRLVDGSYKLSDMGRLIHLGLLCTLNDPQLRPNMKWVLEVLSGNLCAKLPELPSFRDNPPYISISSSSSSDSSNITNTTTGSSTTTTTTSTTTTSMTKSVSTKSSTFLTAKGDTLYASIENGSGGVSPLYKSDYKRAMALPRIDIPHEISFKEIVSATNNFADSRKIAEVGFGTAYHGILDNNQHVLVKRLGTTVCDVARTRFTNELQNLGKLRHRNLVQLRGWCTDRGEMIVLYDYSATRVLSHPLFHHDGKNGHPILQWSQRYNIVKSLASAICYLHEEWDEQVIHKNITSSSIILDSDMNPRLGCFALAEFVTRNEQEYKVVPDTRCPFRGMFGYMPPEFMESGQATPMTDIYSFGVVMLEIVSGQMAVDFSRPEVLLVKRVHEFEVRKRRYEELADWRLDGQYNHKEVVRLVKLGMACTRANPKLRPSIRKIVSILDGYDRCFMEEGQMKETREEWKRKNSCSLSLAKRVQGLGIQ